MPQGPAGGPRPLANSTIEVQFHVEGRTPTDVEMEHTLRQELDMEDSIDVVTKRASYAGASQDVRVIHVITRQEDISAAALSVLISVVKDMLKQDISNSNIIIQTR